MMNLIIVESPTKAKTLTRFLGKNYLVEATMGHIKDLPKSKLSVDMENNFKPNYLPVENKEKNIKKILASASKVDTIYIATDPDREGEAIAQHVYEVLSDSKKKIAKENIKRISFHEITKSAVEHAMEKPGVVNANLVDAQIARRVLDRVVGYKLSPLLWKKVRRHLSAGRVQTVTVRLIVEKEKEIEAFNSQEYWEFYSHTLTSKKDKLAVKLLKTDGKKIEITNEKDAKELEADLKKAEHKVVDLVARETKKSPYSPFRTSTLTQSAANLFSWPAKRTMSAAQKLYEEGNITYHRTDSTAISKEAISMVRNFIEKEYGQKYLPSAPRVYKTKAKTAQEAHEAIRPTDVSVQSVKIDTKYGGDAEKLYGLIWARFVASQMSVSVYDQTRIVVEAKGAKTHTLTASGQTMKFDGWRKVLTGSANGEVILPEVAVGESLQLEKVETVQKFTQPPARFNEASLIKKLEELEIGRPSTYAPIISTIQARAYVEKDEGRFYPTAVGIAVNDFLLKYFENVFDYSFTAEMEGDLDQIAEGKLKWEEPIKKFWDPVEVKIEDVEKNAERVKIAVEKLGRPCPTCKEEGRKGEEAGELIIRTGRFGKFISCDKFPDCKHTESYMQKIKMKCPTCEEEGRVEKEQGDVVIKKTRRGRKFFGCSKYPKCDFASWKNPLEKEGEGTEEKNGENSEESKESDKKEEKNRPEESSGH